MVSHLFTRGMLAVLLLVWGSVVYGGEPDARRLAEGLRPFLAVASAEPVGVQAEARFPIDGKPQTVTLHFDRLDRQTFRLQLEHADYAVEIRRTADATAFALPKHRTVYLGRGEIHPEDHLAPAGFLARVIGPRSMAALALPLLSGNDPHNAAQLLTNLLNVTYEADADRFRIGKQGTVRFSTETPSLSAEIGQISVTWTVTEPRPMPSIDEWTEMELVPLEREELERQLARGLRRTLEVLAPSPVLTQPEQTPRAVKNGELRWVEGQRVAILRGSPEEVGRAHGELLAGEAQACIDSVLYAFGTVQTVRTGRWFRHDLEAAYARLSPHIPERHKRETRALAEAVGVAPSLAETLNVFPELFHCSGFALFGSATKDGKLYHGRVLDYMTAIGLQDAATTFVMDVEGRIPFVNVGYAGFIGSVTGMNAQAVSLGEMGGAGEGEWDGVPMATLMRRALEECSTLEEVMDLWKNSPRTCEYYYVFADGKTNRAVGVAAVPEKVEFVFPGEGHPLLGEGIPDAVVLSAGSRLEKLRERVQEKHGQIDAEAAMWLMSRPVAMQSNLHNVLFVPADGVLYVANADHRRPAAECHYVRLDLGELLESIGE
jgi:hypothetical protein